MTILSTKRPVSNNNGSETSGNANQTTSRSRDGHNVSSEAVSNQFNNKEPEKNDASLEKRFKNAFCERRERDRQKRRELRGKRKQSLQTKHVVSPVVSEDAVPIAEKAHENEGTSEIALTRNIETHTGEDGSGCNSEDEYDAKRPFTKTIPTDEEWAIKDASFSKCLTVLGFKIKEMAEDGACLFRAIADQIYGDQEMHFTVRSQCMDYIVKNRGFFAPYVTEDFDRYVDRKRKWNVHGNHLEIQAISEMYNRKIEVYCYHTEPINIFNASSSNSYEPIRVSYHRMCHYNSIINPKKPSILVGLGLPNYFTVCGIDRRETREAVRQSEDLLIEQAMLEDKIKATDWEATNEAIEEQIARESYIQYYRDAERRLNSESHSNSAAASSSATVTSATSLSPSFRKGSTSPKGYSPHKESTFPKRGYSVQVSSSRLNPSSETINSLCETSILINYNQHLKNDSIRGKNSPSKKTEISQNTDMFPIENASAAVCNKDDVEELDDSIMAQVLAESQLSYFEDLKRKAGGSPVPSTSYDVL